MTKLWLLLLVAGVCVNIYAQKKCKVDHFWRPFEGDIPSDAFIAGYSHSGKPVYVLQIVPLDDDLWSTPLEYVEGQNIRFGWNDGNEMDITRFIKILCYDEHNTLEWVKIQESLDEVADKCCLVEAGFGKGKGDNKIYVSRIGRVQDNQNVTKIGRSYEKYYTGVHLGSGRNTYVVLKNYEVLAYGCPKKIDYDMDPKLFKPTLYNSNNNNKLFTNR